MNKNDINAEIYTMPTEPYVKLENGEELKEWDKECEVLYNQQWRHKLKLDFYRNAFEFIYAHKLQGDYFEFGCHKARTFRMALTEARKKNFTNMNFWAFDSFEGLPDTSTNFEHNPVYAPNELSTPEESFLETIKEHGLFVDKVKTVKGFYQESLTDELKNGMKNQNTKASLVTLDCSLYDSFVASFAFVEDFIQEGTVIYIDDYRVIYKGSPIMGAAKAFREFEKKSKFLYEPFLDIGWFGKSFIAYRGV